MSLKRLMLVVGANTQEFDAATTRMQSSMQRTGEQMATVGKSMTAWVTGPLVGAATGLVALAVKAGSTADRILDLSEITGMSTESIQEYQHVARVAGVSTEAVSSAVEGLVRRLPQLVEGEGQAAQAMQELGIAFRTSTGEMRSGEAIIDDLITALADMENPIERNTLGSQAFGGAWKDMAPILAMGTAGIEEARARAHDLGTVMSRDALEGADRFRQGVVELQAQFGGLTNELGARLAPVLENTLLPIMQDHLVPLIVSVVGAIARAVEWFGNLPEPVQRAAIAAAAIAAALGPALVVLGTVIKTLAGLKVAFAATVAVAKVLAAGVALLASPVAAIIAVFAALVAAGVLIYRNWEEIKEQAAATWDGVVGVFESVRDRFLGFVDGVKEMFAGLWESISNVAESIKGALSAINPFSRQSPSLVDNVRAGVQAIKDEYASLGHAVDDVFRDRSVAVSAQAAGFVPGVDDDDPAAAAGTIVQGDLVVNADIERLEEIADIDRTADRIRQIYGIEARRMMAGRRVVRAT